MASIYKRQNSKFWIACFTDDQGRQLKRSTKLLATASNRRKANQIADEYETTARNRRTESQVRKVLSELFERRNSTPFAHETVSAFAEKWIAEKRLTVGKATLDKYKHVTKLFIESLENADTLDIQFVTTTNVEKFREMLANRVTPATANNQLKILRVFLGAARSAGLVNENVAERVSLIRRNDTVVRRGFTVDEIKSVLQHADDEWEGLILFGFYTGQRLSDLASLTWGSIEDLGSPNSAVNFVTGKTRRRQVVPLAGPLANYLKRIRSTRAGLNSDAIFPSAFEAIRKNSRTAGLSNEFRELLVAAGLAEKRTHATRSIGRDQRRQTSELSFHSLRHTTTSLLKSSGVSGPVAQDIVGHDSAAMSAHYTKIDDGAKRDAINRLPDLCSAT